MGQLTGESLSDLLRKYRGRAGLTQAALAAKAGLSDQAISVLERGTRTRPRIDTTRALIEVLRLDKAEAAEFLAVARGKRVLAESSESEGASGAKAIPIPWQLPPAVSDFTGRSAQIQAIVEALGTPDLVRRVAAPVVAVSGMGGVGKTALAVHASRELVDAYPDGHLYLNLRGYGPGKPISTGAALRQLLRSLGTDPRRIPDDVEEAAGLLRSQLADRRVLLLLDDAINVQHVLPLLPGSADSAAIITSREYLGVLPGARQVRLDVLSEPETIELLSAVAGPSRIAAEPTAADTLVSLAGRLPLAVRLLGARLAARPTWSIRHFVELLEDEGGRLDGFGSDETGVRATIAGSVRFLTTSDRPLDQRAGHALPALGALDGTDLLTGVAAPLLNVSLAQAAAILERLTDLNLLESVAPERYRFHDLIRTYARELCAPALTSGQYDAALERVLRYYIGCAWRCHALTHPNSPRRALATIEAENTPAPSSRESVLRWFDAEHRNLMDRFVQISASSLRRSPLLPELALAMFGFHEARNRWAEMSEMGRGSVDIALSNGLERAAAWLQHDEAIPEVENGDLESAARYLRSALVRFQRLSDLAGQARCYSSLTFVLTMVGQATEALRCGDESLRLSQAINDKVLEGVAHQAIAALYNESGDHHRANAGFRRAIDLATSIGDHRSAYKRHLNAAYSHLRAGCHNDALAYLQDKVVEEHDDEVGQLESNRLFAKVYAARGDYARAQHHAEIGLELAQRTDRAPRHGAIALDLAGILAAAGDRSGAITHAEEAAAILARVSSAQLAIAETLIDRLQSDEPFSYDFVPDRPLVTSAPVHPREGGGSAD